MKEEWWSRHVEATGPCTTVAFFFCTKLTNLSALQNCSQNSIPRFHLGSRKLTYNIRITKNTMTRRSTFVFPKKKKRVQSNFCCMKFHNSRKRAFRILHLARPNKLLVYLCVYYYGRWQYRPCLLTYYITDVLMYNEDTCVLQRIRFMTAVIPRCQTMYTS